jgi:hypothetical protein
VAQGAGSPCVIIAAARKAAYGGVYYKLCWLYQPSVQPTVGYGWVGALNAARGQEEYQGVCLLAAMMYGLIATPAAVARPGCLRVQGCSGRLLLTADRRPPPVLSTPAAFVGPSQSPPGGLQPDQVPQFVLFTVRQEAGFGLWPGMSVGGAAARRTSAARHLPLRYCTAWGVARSAIRPTTSHKPCAQPPGILVLTVHCGQALRCCHHARPLSSFLSACVCLGCRSTAVSPPFLSHLSISPRTETHTKPTLDATRL